MARKLFTENEIEILAANPYTLDVNSTMIRYTDEFKDQYRRRLILGHICTRIFKDLGYDINILGSRRIYSFDSRLKEDMRLNIVRKPEINTDPIVDPEAVIARLQHEVIYLRQELEFIKKIIKANNSKR